MYAEPAEPWRYGTHYHFMPQWLWDVVWLGNENGFKLDQMSELWFELERGNITGEIKDNKYVGEEDGTLVLLGLTHGQ